MPDKWPLANGNWSNAANWNDGTLPQPGDDVYADGKTVTINQDVNVASIRNTQRSGGTAGGTFSTSGVRIITANLINLGNDLLTTTSNTTINGNISGGSYGGGSAGCVRINSASLIIINGNVTGGNGSGGHGIFTDQNDNLIINGNVTGGSGSGAMGIKFAFGNSGITVVGNVTGGTSQAIGLGSGSTNRQINVTGNILGGSQPAIFIDNTGSATSITITGNVTGGNNAAIVVNASNSIPVTIVGNCYSSLSGNGAAVSYSGTGRVMITGDCYGGLGSVGVAIASSSGINRLSGNSYSSSTGYIGISCAGRLVINNTATRTITARTDNAGAIGNEFGYSTDTNLPATSNVRSGITYGAGGLQIGTCAVPSAASVAIGVPVDNTVGTALLTEEDVREAISDLQLTVYVSPAAFTSPGKITGRTLRPYYKDTSRLGPIGIADSTKTPVDLSAFEGDLYVSVMDSDTLEVLLYDDDPYFVTSNLYIDPSPESVGVLDAPLCWALRRISDNKTLMEGPWEVQFAAYGT